jgi:nitrogen-specific signal transduction histidine kinase/CheY-like chemotaxis protein
VLLDFDGEASNVVLARDVTERREMFARIAVADRMLSVGTLAAGVAHEVNNPLAYVMSNLSILADQLPALLSGEPGCSEGSGRARISPSDVEVLLRDAQEGAARVSAIVRDLRAVSRADDETHGSVDIARVLASSMKMAHNEIRHRARVLVDIEDGLPRVNGNASRLGQVFLNLLVNAAQAIPVGHADANEIRVRARATNDGRQLVVEIEDTGTGIPASVIDRIFDPFFTTKPIGVGTGLGLAISHQIVRSVGGEITVASTPDQGSCFRVTLTTTKDAPLPNRSRARRTGPHARVLMVDDEAALGRSTRLLLAPEHEVVNVTRAREALDRLATGDRFDVILCDLMMPEMSGIEFHRQLAVSAPEYLGRVVFVTGGAFTNEARAFLAEMACPHVEKPFTETTLRLAIETIAKKSASSDQTS